MRLHEFSMLLKTAGCTKKAFARLLGVHAGTVSRWGAEGAQGLPIPQYAIVIAYCLTRLQPAERKAILIKFAQGV